MLSFLYRSGLILKHYNGYSVIFLNKTSDRAILEFLLVLLLSKDNISLPFFNKKQCRGVELENAFYFCPSDDFKKDIKTTKVCKLIYPTDKINLYYAY